MKTDADYNPVKIIRHAIETANDELINQAERCASMAGMGTTIVVTTIVGNYVYVANVGDSRLYLMDSKLRQITKDHSLVQEMAWRASGRRSPKSSGQKYYYQSVGSQERCEHRFL